MQPGRELDALVAEKVMGYKVRDEEHYEVPPLRAIYWIPKYSTDIAAAWMVVEKLKGLEPELSWSDEDHCWFVHFQKSRPSICPFGITAPHAICLAALKAIGHEL